MSEKVFEIIAAIAKSGDGGISVDELRERLDEQNLWDSLLHVELVFALEAEFNIFFDQEEIAEIDTPAKVIAAVNSKVQPNET